ncbi:hypothetical protein ABZT27_31290 [Streptomyces sp. NPDC005389]|uniref:hypothetical protein n=1 Tax=Streptomyces sp. NPDC005389 TaxID=3157040 RepID=UPI0033B36D72
MTEPPRTGRGPAAAPERGPAAVERARPADRLYLALWNRIPGAVTTAGHGALARLWRENSVAWPLTA